MAINRPFKNGLLLKGAYTWGKAMNETDEDGWATLVWSQPSQLQRNFALAGYDRTHIFQMGFVYELPFAKNESGPVAAVIKDWQINGIVSAFSGTPFTIAGDNTALSQRQGQQTIDQISEPRRVGRRRTGRAVLRSGRVRAAGQQVGQHGAQLPARPGQWNLDFSVFKVDSRSAATGASSAPRRATC